MPKAMSNSGRTAHRERRGIKSSIHVVSPLYKTKEQASILMVEIKVLFSSIYRFLPMLTSSRDTTHPAAKRARIDEKMTIGFRKPAMKG